MSGRSSKQSHFGYSSTAVEGYKRCSGYSGSSIFTSSTTGQYLNNNGVDPSTWSRTLTFSAPWSANHFLPYTERKRLTLSTLGLGFALGLPVIRCFCFVHSDPQPQPALRQHKVFRGSCRGRHDVSVVASPTIRSGISRDAPYTPREPPTHAS